MPLPRTTISPISPRGTSRPSASTTRHSRNGPVMPQLPEPIMSSASSGM
jgi:hypothetical protein